MWSRAEDPACLLDRENPERAGLLTSHPSWFQPVSKNHKNGLFQYFNTSASRPRKEQEVWGRVKMYRKEELNPLHVKGSKTSSVTCYSTWALMCFHWAWGAVLTKCWGDVKKDIIASSKEAENGQGELERLHWEGDTWSWDHIKTF